MTETLAKAVLQAQDDFQVALRDHRQAPDERSRLALEMARRRLDEIQRIAVADTEQPRAMR